MFKSPCRAWRRYPKRRELPGFCAWPLAITVPFSCVAVSAPVEIAGPIWEAILILAHTYRIYFLTKDSGFYKCPSLRPKASPRT
jgi:hypothetical protein